MNVKIALASLLILPLLSQENYVDEQPEKVRIRPFEFLFVDIVNEPHDCITNRKNIDQTLQTIKIKPLDLLFVDIINDPHECAKKFK